MNISGGISEINFLSGAGSAQKSSKVYVWPVYDSGAVTKVQKIVRETGPDISHLESYSNVRNNGTPVIDHSEYTPGARVNNRPSYYPGYYFNALA